MLAFTKRSGFSLIELMVSIAIIGILSAIVFTSLANERSRNAVKRSAEQLQVDLQRIQTQAQTSRIHDTTLCLDGTNDAKYCDGTPSFPCPNGSCVQRPPLAYGIVIYVNETGYQFFTDGTITADGLPNEQAGPHNEVTNSRPFFQDVELRAIRYSVACTSTICDAAVLRYLVPTADARILDAEGGTQATVTFVLGHTKKDICYSVTVIAATGLVSRRSLESCP